MAHDKLSEPPPLPLEPEQGEAVPENQTIQAGISETDLSEVPADLGDDYVQDPARRETFKKLAIGTIAVAEALSLFGMVTWFARSDQTLVGRLLSKRDRFVEMLNSQPTTAQVVAQFYAIPGIMTSINLAHERALLGITEGLLPVDELDSGNSYTYKLGIRNDGGGLFNQPNAVSSVAVSGLDDEAMAQLGARFRKVGACARIGAMSGDNKVIGEKGPAYSFLSDLQLGGREVQDYLLAGDGIKVERRDLELDDYGELVTTSAELVSSLSDIKALFTDDRLDAKVEARLQWLEAQVPAIAARAGGNYERAADTTLAPISLERLARGDGHIINVAVICWDIGSREQAVLPASVRADKQPSAAALRYLIPDPTGPNRYYLLASSIPYGHEIAHWIWVEMTLARIKAVGNVVAKYGGVLPVVPEDLSRVNQDPDFYRSKLLGKIGNGHEGEKGILDMAGVHLGLFQNPTPNGVVIASSLANLPHPKQ